MDRRVMIDPQPGYWLVRLVKGGPLVPACICWCETTSEPGEPTNLMEGTRYRTLGAFIAGKPVPVDRIWLTRGEPITEADYRFRAADAVWAAEHAPDEPAANPGRPIDPLQIPLPL